MYRQTEREREREREKLNIQESHTLSPASQDAFSPLKNAHADFPAVRHRKVELLGCYQALRNSYIVISLVVSLRSFTLLTIYH